MITIDFKRLGIHDGMTILDIGCGSGRHLGEAVRHPNTFAVGTDVAFGNLMDAAGRIVFQDKFGEAAGNWGLCASTICCLPFEDHSFDTVICAEVLEHIPDDKSAIDELNRVLKPGRILAISVPRFFPEWICWKLSKDYRTAENGHVRIYQKKRLIERVQNSGFVLSGAHYAHSLHTPYWWLKCMMAPFREDLFLIHLYHRFLTWNIFKKPRMIRLIDRLLNPVLGKSLALYFQKQ